MLASSRSTESTPAAPTGGWEPAATAIVAGAILVALASSDGGYFPPAWSWLALAAAWTLALLLLFRPERDPSLPMMVCLGALLALAVVIALSALWSEYADVWPEVQRVLILPLVVGVIFVRPTARSIGGPLAGVTLGATAIAIYALSTRLFPERLGVFDPVAGYRLSDPLGYWNALGILCVFGMACAVGLASRAPRVGAALAGAAVPILATTLYFTFSRGAWVALAAGLAASLTLDAARVRQATMILAAAPISAAAVYFASRSDALTRAQASLDAASRDGHRLALVVILLALIGAIAVILFHSVEGRVRFGATVSRAWSLTLLASLVALAAGVLIQSGGPITLAERAQTAFTAPPPNIDGDLNARLFNFSGSYRAELWEVAWSQHEAHRILGAGAGSFESYWLEHREAPLKVKDAHSLYLEVLAELGPLGLALLLLALSVPVYAAFKARRHPFVPAAFGAYVAYLVHAGVDWDWEMPAVTLTALFIGASIVVAARKPEDEERVMSPRLRYGLLAGTLALAAVAFVGLVGNMALAQSADAARAGDWDESESKARRAETWAPWSPEPWQRIGEAQLAVGELGNARASFRKAIAKDERDWNLWLDLARASEGKAQGDALAQATRLNPLSPELAQLRKELAELGTIEVGG